MIIRAAETGDADAIRRIVAAAFGRQEEAAIVEGVRREGAALCELVAEDAGAVIGHVLFSAMAVVPSRCPIAALGPLAVAPEAQGRGVGSALARTGVRRCRELGSHAIVVLGHPNYYPRFGFSADAAVRLASPYAGRPAFMAMALVGGALDEPLNVAYPAAFG